MSEPSDMDGRSVLVTGCAGFIGARVCEMLLSTGYRVSGVDSLNDAYDVSLKRWRLSRLDGHANFSFHRLDIVDQQTLARFFEEQAAAEHWSAVVNLAARAGVRYSVQNPWVYYQTNVTGTLNLLELCRHHGVAKFVLASSSSLYGAGNPLPYEERQTTDRPLSPYAASKKAAEALCYTYHHLHALDITIFRYFTVFGPAGRPDMLPFRLVQWISEGRPVIVYGDGMQSRDFTYVDDIALGTIAGLSSVGYEVINLGSERPIVIMDFIRLVERLVERQALIQYQPRHAADVEATWADISKAKRLLAWRPQTSFQDGVARLVDWYQAEQGWTRNISTT